MVLFAVVLGKVLAVVVDAREPARFYIPALQVRSTEQDQAMPVPHGLLCELVAHHEPLIKWSVWLMLFLHLSLSFLFAFVLQVSTCISLDDREHLTQCVVLEVPDLVLFQIKHLEVGEVFKWSPSSDKQNFVASVRSLKQIGVEYF